MKDQIIKEIDRYYFQELLPAMHPVLRGMGGNKRLIYLDSESEPLTTLHHVFGESYLLLPWQCADIISISDHELIIVSQAYTALLIAYFILDRMVDGQLPDEFRLAPLIYGHFLLLAREKFAEYFPPDDPFWEDFDNYLHELFDGLAAEAAAVDLRLVPYSDEVMREVAHGKNAPLRLAARAMAHIANAPEKGDLCEELIDTMFVGDQFNDDTIDWREDFELGRLTYPIIQAMDAEGLPYEEFASLTTEQLESIVTEKQIVQKLIPKNRSVFESGLTLLEEADYPDSRMAAVLKDRIALTERIKRREGASRLFGILAQKLRDRLE